MIKFKRAIAKIKTLKMLKSNENQYYFQLFKTTRETMLYNLLFTLIAFYIIL